MIDRIRCLIGYPRFVSVDVTDGQTWMGTPLLVQVCAWCRETRGGVRHA